MDRNTFPPPPSTSNGNPPAAVLGSGFPRYPNDKLNGLFTNNVVNGNASNQPEELLNLQYTTENGYWDQNNLAAPWQPSEMNLHESGANAIYSSSVGQLITEKSHIQGQAEHFNASGVIPNPSSILSLLLENLQNRSLDPRMFSVNVDNDIFARNQRQISSAQVGSFLTNNSVKGDTEIRTTFSSSASSLIQPKKEETSSKKIETDLSIFGNVSKIEERTISSNADEIVVCETREKLWNGTLQLSSSVQSSVAAYFRSGEKMPDIYWTDSIGVKGKVRLEAFEKYIQDLPRSKSRGLMVMSLCLKEGSGKGGSKAIFEVIEKYKTGKRVGRAQISPGVDVYVCPNTEKIITILSKNGFSKGSESFQDSLIGCAVWRKDSSSKTETEAPANDVHAINSIVKKMTEIEDSIFRSLGIQNHQGNLQLLKTILPSSDLPTEDDDLPEYDFSSAMENIESQKDVNGGALVQKRKIRNLFDEDDMPEWQPPDIKHYKALNDQTTRPPFVHNTFRPPLPPQPPLRPPQFRPADHSRWSHQQP